MVKCHLRYFVTACYQHLPDIELLFPRDFSHLFLHGRGSRYIQDIVGQQLTVAIWYQCHEIPANGHDVKETVGSRQVTKIFARKDGTGGKPDTSQYHLTMIELIPVPGP